MLLLLLLFVCGRGAGGGKVAGLKEEGAEEEDMLRLEGRVEERLVCCGGVEVVGEGEGAREEEVRVPAKVDLLVSCKEGEGGPINTGGEGMLREEAEAASGC